MVRGFRVTETLHHQQELCPGVLDPQRVVHASPPPSQRHALTRGPAGLTTLGSYIRGRRLAQCSPRAPSPLPQHAIARPFRAKSKAHDINSPPAEPA